MKNLAKHKSAESRRLIADQKYMLLISLVALAAMVVLVINLLKLDTLVNLDLYNYGLQFSYDWATSYWMYLRLCLAIVGVMLVVNCVFLAYLFLQRHTAAVHTLRPTINSEKRSWMQKGRRTIPETWKTRILIVVFATLMLISMATTFISHQSPIDETI
ncbi:MAG: hypothetical protein ACFE7R_03940, partial [Candidatus Hodarchaeota archaeon]